MPDWEKNWETMLEKKRGPDRPVPGAEDLCMGLQKCVVVVVAVAFAVVVVFVPVGDENRRTRRRRKHLSKIKQLHLKGWGKTDNDSDSESTINDLRTEAKDVNLPKRTTRFQILRTRLPKGFECVHAPHTKILKTTRPSGVRTETGPKCPERKRKKVAECEQVNGQTSAQAIFSRDGHCFSVVRQVLLCPR